MLTVAPGGNNLATICYKDFLDLATINIYYYYYYYYYYKIMSRFRDCVLMFVYCVPMKVNFIIYLIFLVQ